MLTILGSTTKRTSRLRSWMPFLTVSVFTLLSTGLAHAGMPAILPTPWTAENPGEFGRSSHTPMVDQLFQGISFFGMSFLATAAGVRWTWNYLRRDIKQLPYLSYGRALALTVLWGFLLVIVLTMISGARELMTPGAWQKQGWTYSLNTSPSDYGAAENRSATSRQQALEKLRFHLWNYAATHDGQFPAVARIAPLSDNSNDRIGLVPAKPKTNMIPSSSWDIPGWPGVTFQYVGGQSADTAGSVLVFEPSLERDQRLVLLTNGVVGTIPVEELRRLLPSLSAEVTTETADASPVEPNGDHP